MIIKLDTERIANKVAEAFVETLKEMGDDSVSKERVYQSVLSSLDSSTTKTFEQSVALDFSEQLLNLMKNEEETK